MKVQIQSYGILSDILGSKLQLKLAKPHTAQNLLRQLSAEFPQFAEWESRTACAVNDELLRGDDNIAKNAEVSLIPPVGGG